MVAVAFGQSGLGPIIADVTAGLTVFTFSVTGVPAPQVFVWVQKTDPAVVPQLTVIEFVPCPKVMFAPTGTVQLYIEPIEFVTE